MVQTFLGPNMMDETSALPASTVDSAASAGTSSSAHHLQAFAEGNDAPTFQDVLDTINPLQHIPIINTVYRKLTGDEPGAVSRMAGGALYGGPIGMFLAGIDSAIDDETGNDLGGHIYAALFGDDDDQNDTKLAQNDEQTVAHQPETPDPVQVSAAETPSPEPDVTPPPEPIATAAPIPVAVSPVTPKPALLNPKLAQAVPTPVSPPAAAAATPAAVSGATPLPQGFMPAPSRHTIQVMPPTPPSSVISTSAQNSTVPNAGHVVASTAQAANAQAPQQTTPPNAWLPDAMAKALDKYQRMNKLNQSQQISAAPVSGSAQPNM